MTPNPVPSIPSREAVEEEATALDELAQLVPATQQFSGSVAAQMLRDLLAEVERLREFRNKVTTIAEWHEEEATIEELNDKRLMHEAYARVLRSL